MNIRSTKVSLVSLLIRLLIKTNFNYMDIDVELDIFLSKQQKMFLMFKMIKNKFMENYSSGSLELNLINVLSVLHFQSVKTNSSVFNCRNDGYHNQSRTITKNEILLIKYAIENLYLHHQWKINRNLSLENFYENRSGPGIDPPIQNHPTPQTSVRLSHIWNFSKEMLHFISLNEQFYSRFDEENFSSISIFEMTTIWLISKKHFSPASISFFFNRCKNTLLE